MQRIEVTEDIITLTYVTEPRFSIFGNEVSPGQTTVHQPSWDDISRIGLMKVRWHPERPPQACLVIDLTWGEFFEITEDAEGFPEALRELCHQADVPVPDYRNLPDEGIDILQDEPEN